MLKKKMVKIRKIKVSKKSKKGNRKSSSKSGKRSESGKKSYNSGSSAGCKHMLLVKRYGHLEKFDIKKVYASVYAATLNAHYTEKDAEMIASLVSKHVYKTACKKKKIDSKDIKLEVIHELNEIDEDIAFLYETHLDIN